MTDLNKNNSQVYVLFETREKAKESLFKFASLGQMLSLKGRLPNDINAFVMDAEISEGVSIPFRITLTVASAVRYSKRQCKNLLNTPVVFRNYIQFDNGENSSAKDYLRERRLEGIVTSITALETLNVDFAIPFKKPDGVYSVYKIVIEPDLCTLKKSKNRKNIHTGASLLEKIFAAVPENIYRTKHSSFDADAQKSGFNENAALFDVSDSDISDLAYLSKLCFAYGVNYNFGYTRDNSRFTTCFSRGSDTISSFGTVFDGKGKLIDCANIPGCRIDSKQGCTNKVNVVNQIFSTADIDGPVTDYSITYNLLGYDQDINKEALNKYEKIQQDSVDGCHFCDQEKVLIKSADIRYTPGTFLEFTDNTQGIDAKKYLILRAVSKVYCNVNSCLSEEYKSKTCFEQKLAAVPYSADRGLELPETLGGMQYSTRLNFSSTPDNFFVYISPFAGKSSHSKHAEEKKETVVPVVPAHVPAAAESKADIIVGTVCNKEGKTTELTADQKTVNIEGQIRYADDANLGNPNKFYVSVNGTDKPLSVFMTSDFSNFENCSGFPVVGQEVLVLKLANANYFLGYPSNTLNFAADNSSYIDSTASSTAFTFTRKGTSNTDVKTKFDYYRGGLEDRVCSRMQDVIINMLLKGKLEAFLRVLTQNSAITESGKTIIDRFNNADQHCTCANTAVEKLTNTNGDKDQTTVNDFKKLGIAAFGDSLISEIVSTRALAIAAQSAKDKEYYNNRLKTLSAVLTAYADDVLKTCICFENADLANSTSGYPAVFAAKGSSPVLPYKSDQTTLISQGDLRLFSGSNASLNLSDGITEDTAGKVIINADDEIVLKSGKGVSINVGNSSFVVDNKGITLSTKRFDTSHSLFNYSIALDATSGCRINACDLNIKTFSSASIADSFGGEISTKMGRVSANGAEVTMAALEGSDIFANAVPLGLESVNAIVERISSGRGGQITQGVINATVETVLTFIGNLGGEGKISKFVNSCDKAHEVCFGGATLSSKDYADFVERQKAYKNKVDSLGAWGEKNVAAKNDAIAEMKRGKTAEEQAKIDANPEKYWEKYVKQQAKNDANNVAAVVIDDAQNDITAVERNRLSTYFGGTLLQDKDGYHYSLDEKNSLLKEMWIKDVFSKVWGAGTAAIGFGINMSELIAELVGQIQDTAAASKIANGNKDATGRSEKDFEKFKLSMFLLKKINMFLSAIPSYALCIACSNASKLEVSGGTIASVSDKGDYKSIIKNEGRTPVPRVGEKAAKAIVIGLDVATDIIGSTGTAVSGIVATAYDTSKDANEKVIDLTKDAAAAELSQK